MRSMPPPSPRPAAAATDSDAARAGSLPEGGGSVQDIDTEAPETDEVTATTDAPTSAGSPVPASGGSESESDSESDSGSDDGEDLDVAMEKIQQALQRAHTQAEEDIEADKKARIDVRAQALAQARQEALDAAENEAREEARARARAEGAAGVSRDETLEDLLLGSVLGGLASDVEPEPEPEPKPDLQPQPEPEPNEGHTDRARTAAADRLKHIKRVEEAEEQAQNEKRWKKTKTPMQLASMFTAAQKENEEKAAAIWGGKGSAWKRAKAVKHMAGAVIAVEEMSADLFMMHRKATYIQAHIRCFLVRARLGMGPGDSLVNESTRQMVQTVLAERKLAEAMANLTPEAQVGVSKMGTQLANMTKDVTFNNAAEHLVLCIKDRNMSMLVVNFALTSAGAGRPIHHAARFKNLRMTNFLLGRAAELNLRDKAGWTALHHACAPPFPSAAANKDEVLVDVGAVVRSCTLTAEALLARGAMFSVPDNRGFTPLHLVAFECIKHINFFHINTNDLEAAAYAQCCFQMMGYLVDTVGCKLGTVDRRGNSMLGTCAIEGGPGGVDVAGWLLDRGADFEHVNREGKTPFFLALQHGHGGVAALLRDVGADQNAMNRLGITPKEHALFLRRITHLLYCEKWPRDFMDALKEEKLWTGCEVSQGVDRMKRELTQKEQQDLNNLEELISSPTWKWGTSPPAAFTEFHNPSHRDFESPFEIFDPVSLGNLLYYDSMWVQMDDEGDGMATNLTVDCGLFFVPLAQGSWRCTWPGRLLGSDGQAEWVLSGGIQPLKSFKAHERGITSTVVIATSTSGERELVTTISEGLDAKIWDLPAMRCAATLTGHRERVTCVVCASNVVFTGSVDRTIRVWSLLQNGECVAVLRGHTDSITALAVDTAAIWLASGAHDGSIRIWHVPARTCTAIFGESRNAGLATAAFPRCLVMDETRSHLYCGLQNGELQLWNLHQHLVTVKRPSVANRTKPKLLLPGKPDELVAMARENVTIVRSNLLPLSVAPFDTWEHISPQDQKVLLPGCVYTYTLTAKNFGAPLKTVVIKDMLETGLKFVECRPVAASVQCKREFNGRTTVHWQIENLGVAKEAELTFHVMADTQGAVARPLRLMKGEGLAVMRMKFLQGQLHCGFQGGNVVRLAIHHEKRPVKLSHMFKSTPEDDDPWAVGKVQRKSLLIRFLLCCVTCAVFRRSFKYVLSRCRASDKYKVSPAQGKKPIAHISDTQFLNQMIDLEGDLERSVLVTGLDGDDKWTTFCVGKHVYSVPKSQKKETVKNHHPISVRAVEVTNGSMLAGYSDGVIRVWPMRPLRSWEDTDLFFVLLINIGYTLLFFISFLWFWRAGPVIQKVLSSLSPCQRWRHPLSHHQRRELIKDTAIVSAIDALAVVFIVQYAFLAPTWGAVKDLWRVKPTNFIKAPDAFKLEVVNTYIFRLEHHFEYLDTIARYPRDRLLLLSHGFATFCREALFGGHRSEIVCMDTYGTRLFSACKAGVVVEWNPITMTDIVAQWLYRPGISCMQFFPVTKSLVTLWVGTADGHLDVHILGTGQLLCSFHEDLEIQQKFEELDQDKSGSLDAQELAQLIKQLLESGRAEAGKKTIAEGTKGMRKLNSRCLEMAVEILADMDDDNSGEIDFAEFSMWWKAYRKKTSQGLFGGLFSGPSAASHGGTRGGVTCIATGRLNDHSFLLIGWEDGSILKMQLTKPIGVLQTREVEVLAELKGHLKPVEEITVHNFVIYSRSKTRVLAHNIKTHQCLVSFNDSEEDKIAGFVFLKERMFMAHNNNVLVWDLTESLHRKDPMNLNDLQLTLKGGELMTVRSGKVMGALEGHTAQVTALKLTQKSLFSASADGTTREWKFAQPWDCVNVFDSQSDRVERMTVCGRQIYCSHPDGRMKGWQLRSGFSDAENFAPKKKVNAGVTQALNQLLGQAKSAARDLADITFGPTSGRSIEVCLAPPVAVTCTAAFSTALLDGRVYVGLQSGDLWILEGSSGKSLATVQCGHNNSIGWLILGWLP